MIKIIAWNKGSLQLISKIAEIKEIIKEKKPDVLIVNELQLDNNDDYNIINIQGYNFECDSLLITNGIARTGLWIKDIFNYSRLKNQECEGESIVGIRIGFPKKRKFNIFGYYRQWSRIYNYKNKEKLSFKQMEICLRNQLQKINEVSNIETIIMGDLNIDFRILNKNETERNNYEKNFSVMLKNIQSDLISNNFLQLVKENTHGVKILDHIYSNDINKVHNSSVQVDTSSDHNFIVLEKKMNVTQVEERFVLSRKWQNINYELMQENMLRSEEYSLMLTDDNLNRVTSNLIKMIQYEYDKQAPVIKIKIKDKNNEVLSNETKNMIQKKNILYKEMKENRNSETEKQFKIMACLCRKMVISDKSKNIKNNVNNNIDKPRSIWKTTKDILYGKTFKQP